MPTRIESPPRDSAQNIQMEIGTFFYANEDD